MRFPKLCYASQCPACLDSPKPTKPPSPTHPPCSPPFFYILLFHLSLFYRLLSSALYLMKVTLSHLSFQVLSQCSFTSRPPVERFRQNLTHMDAHAQLCPTSIQLQFSWPSLPPSPRNKQRPTSTLQDWNSVSYQGLNTRSEKLEETYSNSSLLTPC